MNDNEPLIENYKSITKDLKSYVDVAHKKVEEIYTPILEECKSIVHENSEIFLKEKF